MIKCMVCGTANSPDSSLCTGCGADLSMSRRSISTDSEKEIFSDTRTEGLTKSGEQRELYSSGEKYEKVRKGAVLKKIYKQEQAMGEVTELEQPPEPEKVKPIVINRQSSSDIVGKKKYYSKSGKSNSYASKNYKIPQRIIEPVDSQLLGHKIKPQVTSTPEDENVKVELKASDPVADIKKRKKTSGQQNKRSSSSTSVSEKQKHRSNKEKNIQQKNSSADTVKLSAGKRTETPANVSNDTEKKNKPKKTAAAAAAKQPSVSKAETEKKNVKVQSKTSKTYSGERKKSEKTSQVNAGKSVGSESKISKKAMPQTVKCKDAVDIGNTQKPVKKKTSTVSSQNAFNVKKASAHTSKPVPKKTGSLKSFTESDINSNKNIAALSYIGILFIIPLARSGKSNFCKAHSKQGMAVFFYSLVIMLVTLAAVIGLRFLLLWKLGLSYLIYNVFAAAAGILMLILLLIPVFSGAVSAFSGIYRSVPIVGKFVNKK